MEQAEHRSLELEIDECQRARSALTNPRSRLTAEVAWLPGVAPRRAAQLLDGLLRSPMSMRRETGLPTLARCNLLAAAFDGVTADTDADELALFIRELAVAVDTLNAEEVLQDINADRTVSGFPLVKGVDLVHEEISERQRAYKDAIKMALDRLPSETLLDAMTEIVAAATAGGNEPAPALIDELVDSYAIEVQSVLEKEAESVKRLIATGRERVDSGEGAVTTIVERLERVARNFDRLAQPIQLSAKARGMDHELSHDLALSIRSLAIDLFNDHDMLASSQRLTALLRELFAELPEVSERIAADIRALSEIETKRRRSDAQSKEQEAQWSAGVSYSAEVGLLFKDALRISPSGIEWKGKRYALDSIIGVRWGAIRHSVNGVPTGTDYKIGLADRQGSTSIDLKREAVYTGFLNALWRAVCVRLMLEMSEALKRGGSLRFGDLLVEDTHVTLVRHRLLGTNERVRVSWNDVHVSSVNGEFVVGSKMDKKVYGSASYLNDWNTHLLDQVVRGGFKEGVSRLSDFLGK